jgi:ATP-dependent helicase/nuclease subunit A
VVRGKGYYTQEEVTDVVSLLRLLLNPHDDLALLTVLRSPLVGLSDDSLYVLGRDKRSRQAKTLWEVVEGSVVQGLAPPDRAALGSLIEKVKTLRQRVGRPGLARLIDDAVSAFSYDLCLLAAPDGRRRFANVRKLMRLGEQFEAASGPDLAAFVSVVKTTAQTSDNEGSAPTLGEKEDVVRIMTVHQAKGLEFPVVVVAGLGADAHRPKASTFMVGREGQVGVFLKGYRNDTYEEVDPHWGPAAAIMADEATREQEEDLRLLYVAMTRAQGRLVLVGARPAKDEMEKSRIGRIVTALGLPAFPATGETVAVPGLSAEVAGVMGAPGEPPREHRPEGAPAGPAEALDADAAPCFVDLPAATAPPARISFSAFAVYKACPRQFLLQHMLGLSFTDVAQTMEPDEVGAPHLPVMDGEEAHAGREVGVLVHRLLERLAVSAERPTAGAVHAEANRALTDLGLRLSDEHLQRAEALTLALWDSPVAGRLSSHLAAREESFFFSTAGMLVNGIMDLVCREPDCWLVTDYKTNALRGRSVVEVAQPYASQCALYALAALRAGAPAVQMDLLFLEDPSEPVTVRYTREDMPGLERDLLGSVTELRQGSFPRNVSEACERCGAAQICANMVAD